MNDDQRDIEFGRPVPPPRRPARPLEDPSTGPYATREPSAETGAWARVFPAPQASESFTSFGEPSPEPLEGPVEESSTGSFPEAPEALEAPEAERGEEAVPPAPGRRSRRARERTEPALGGALQTFGRFAAHRYGTAALILLAAAALYGVTEISRPGPAPAHRGEVVPVEEALVVCPDAAKARVAVASTGEGAGKAVLRDPVGKAMTTLDDPGTVWTSAPAQTAKRKGPLVVDATGAHAAGLSVVQTTREKRSLSGAGCSAPGTDHWFVTPGPGEGTVDLYLTNAEEGPATVDVHAISDEGSMTTTDGKSLEVPGQASRMVKIGRSLDGLGSLISGTGVIALRVTATGGRVAAAVRTGLGARGADWVPATAGPSREVVLPGVPAGSGRRTLYVGVPGEADARVRIKVITEDGVFAPEGQDTLDVPAGTVVPLDLETSLGGRAAAIVLTSGQELVAGLQAGGDDVSFGAATQPLGPGTTVADARKGSTLLLTAPDAAARVRVTPLGATGAETPQEVRLEAGRTIEVPVEAEAVRIEPLPGSGPVHGARFLTVKSGGFRTATLLALGPAPGSIRLPAVGGSLTTVVSDPGAPDSAPPGRP